MSNDKYITVDEMAAYLHVSAKHVRQYFVQDRRVRWIQLGRRYLIERRSLAEWEAANTKRVARRV